VPKEKKRSITISEREHVMLLSGGKAIECDGGRQASKSRKECNNDPKSAPFTRLKRKVLGWEGTPGTHGVKSYFRFF